MGETMTPTEAARILADTARYEDGLQQRTEGLTAIVWGLVTPGIFATYGLGAVTHGLTPLVASLLWLPWVAAGGLATFALWRSAALTRAPARRAAREGLLALRTFLVGVVAFGVVFAFLRPDSAATPLLIVGVGWAMLGLVNPYRGSMRGRVALAISGALLALTGAALLLARAADDVTGIVAMVVSGVVPIALGTWQTLQG